MNEPKEHFEEDYKDHVIYSDGEHVMFTLTEKEDLLKAYFYRAYLAGWSARQLGMAKQIHDLERERDALIRDLFMEGVEIG